MPSPPPEPPPPPTLPTPSSIRAAATLIAPYIHRTPLLTCATLDRLASTPLPSETPSTTPTFSLYFKTENLQKIGAFKARGAHHALLQLISRLGITEVRTRGVVTHSSGNHAQALALAAKTLGVPATIVMPKISTPSKIAGTKVYCENVIFSGSTSVEREEVVRGVVERTGAILVPPYDDVDVIAGQGTVGLEIEVQFRGMRGWEIGVKEEREGEAEGRRKVKLKEAKSKEEFEQGMDGWFERWKSEKGVGSGGQQQQQQQEEEEQEEQQEENNDGDERATQLNSKPTKTRALCSAALPSPSTTTTTNSPPPTLDAIIAPIGGGGLLGGIASYFSQPSSSSVQKKPLIIGAEPSFQHANDAELGLSSGQRIPHVSSLTIADGLRTPVGVINWAIVSDPAKVAGIYSVTEAQIKEAMKLVFERMKMVVEPSGAVGLAVVLFNERFRRWVAEQQRAEGKGRRWDVGVVFSGGNTTMEAIVALYGQEERPRDEGKVGMNGKQDVEDVAG